MFFISVLNTKLFLKLSKCSAYPKVFSARVSFMRLLYLYFLQVYYCRWSFGMFPCVLKWILIELRSMRLSPNISRRLTLHIADVHLGIDGNVNFFFFFQSLFWFVVILQWERTLLHLMTCYLGYCMTMEYIIAICLPSNWVNFFFFCRTVQYSSLQFPTFPKAKFQREKWKRCKDKQFQGKYFEGD